MKHVMKVFCIISLFIVVTVSQTCAEEMFQITYRMEEIGPAILFLNVRNMSGQDVRDVVATMSGKGGAPMVTRPIFVGDIKSGQTAHVSEPLDMPPGMAPPDMPSGELKSGTRPDAPPPGFPGRMSGPGGVPDEVVWILEFTTKDKKRTAVEVAGKKVHHHNINPGKGARQ